MGFSCKAELSLRAAIVGTGHFYSSVLEQNTSLNLICVVCVWSKRWKLSKLTSFHVKADKL
jgi:hypothetical protein